MGELCSAVLTYVIKTRMLHYSRSSPISSPAAMHASRVANTSELLQARGLREGCAGQACDQSKLGGVPTWICFCRGKNGRSRGLMRRILSVH
eukprot:5168291-Pyramimonas_sp.AAC.1